MENYLTHRCLVSDLTSSLSATVMQGTMLGVKNYDDVDVLYINDDEGEDYDKDKEIMTYGC